MHRFLHKEVVHSFCPLQMGVPYLMKFLSADNLLLLDRTWRDWSTRAHTMKQKRIRLRLYVLYLLIRHGGLRLGEALALNDKRDLVFSTSTIRIANDRDVQIPEHVMTELLGLVEDPAVQELQGHLAHVDPGYVRKNFYLVAESCGLDRTMGGPRVLRHSRGAELLNLGIPVLIVQKYLGLQSPAQAVQLRDFQDSEAREILHSHLRRETLRHSSARNAFAGTISAISESTTMAEVVLSAPSGLEVRARISMESVRSLNLHEGQTVTATVKAPWVVLAPANTQTSNANNYQATVLYVREGPLEASVRLSLEDGTGMAALMGRDGVQRLGLAAGLQCTVSFSSMSVVLTPN